MPEYRSLEAGTERQSTSGAVADVNRNGHDRIKTFQ